MGRLSRSVERFWQRCTFVFGQTYWLSVGAVGVILETLALALWDKWQPWAGILAGIGGSILATVIVSFTGPASNPVYQLFLRMAITEFYPNRDRYPRHKWVDRLLEARRNCVLLGQAHGEWCRDERFAPALIERVRMGVNVEIFFLDPTGPAAKVRHHEDRKGLDDLIRRTTASIRAVWAIREVLEEEARGRLKLYVYNATPSLGLTWIDNTMFVTHYLAGQINLTAPLLRVEFKGATDTLFAVYENNVNELRKNFSKAITRENIGSYLPEAADEH